MATQIKLRRDTYQNWYDANPTLALGEPAYDTTNNKLKIGNGATTWRLLGYLADSTATTSLVNGNKTVSLGTDGTLTVPSPTSPVFTLTFAESNYVPTISKPTLTLTGTPWELHGQYQYNSSGECSLLLDSIFPVLVNPGYGSGDSFTFDSSVHGIAGHTLTIVLNDVVLPGGAGWTANVAASQPPAYPSTIDSLGAIKVTSNENSWIFGTSGQLTVPGAIRKDGGLYMNSGGDGISSTVFVNGNAGSVILRTDNGTTLKSLTFDVDGVLTLPNGIVFDADGSLQMPVTGVSGYQHNATQEITVLAGAAPTVVFTSVNNSVESVKAIIKVSVAQAPADGFVVVDSQICEMLITSKSAVPVGGGAMVRTAVATVYGVTHTSAGPLATFTVNYFNNPVGPSVIQILAQSTAAVTGTDMVVTTVATEIANYF